MSSSRSSFPLSRMFLVIIFVVVISAVVVVPRWYVNTQISSLPPELGELIERFCSEPVEIPESYLNPPEIPGDLLRLVEDNRKLLESLPSPIQRDLETKIREGAEVTEAEWEEVASILSAADQRVRASIELASHSDYWFGVYPQKVPKQGMTGVFPIQSLGHYLPLLAYLQTHQGDYAEAFESLLSLLRLSIRHPSDLLIDQLIGLALTKSAIQPMASVANRCDDIELLKQTLDQLNELAPKIHQNNFADPILASVLEFIHYERKNGGAIEVSPGMTGLDYFRKIVSPTSATSRIRRKLMNQPAAGWVQSLTHFWSALTGSDLILIAMSLPNQLESRFREESIQSAFDLLLITLAGRIHELETGEKVENQTAFVPALWVEPLLDPFSEKPYLWDASSEVFYSVAPDETDDGNRISYSPTNGTTSAGDFSLR